MLIHENIPLSSLTTMQLGGPARYVITLENETDIPKAIDFARAKELPFFVLGGGSNTLAYDTPYNGVILLNQIHDITVRELTNGAVDISGGAGENWDKFVALSVQKGLHGIETMSGIPGTVGASPVQNIGAYGQEVADTFLELRAYDTTTNRFVTMGKNDCGFGYRHSIFRGDATGRYIITNVTFRLSRSVPQPPFYAAVAGYLTQQNNQQPSVADLRNAVLAIRGEKLPDPTTTPNTGSFFKNAVVSARLFNDLIQQHPTMPNYPLENGKYKIPTGWLIEQTGLKGQILHGMKVHEKNALVLINDSAKHFTDLMQARAKIITAVQDKFGITIEQEPLELG